ncbi:hypothetical protein BCR36DRAFT_588501 [Piromyces finnis]|uniref:Sialate O-acetylesterase domain-containing protein n=1 Tax=Piromyces finnis TaxID=1754191 RepID=A0A1Y1UEB0_9FUNG|nr:hypothetical protein BCR36DRAFT_588501 [Piromyces finnis]|eukprot:ORX35844.1 hypothetical protein BCR36DRAFT_588501 [Piromyces finnis]
MAKMLPDPNFHIYLAFGQSNMEGQGPIENQDKTVDKRFQAEWYDAIPPLANCDDLGLKADDVPFLAGEVVQSNEGGQCGSMNSIYSTASKGYSICTCYIFQGLGQQGDGLHFTSAAYRTLGQRYAEEMLKIIGDVEVKN